MKIKTLISEYKKRKTEIKARLAEFRALHKSPDEYIFREMCFCILTANANALHCDKAVKELADRGLLTQRDPRRISPSLRGRVRFHNKKARFIVRMAEMASMEPSE